MSKNMFKNMVKQKCEECGLYYLKHHIKSKGKRYDKHAFKNEKLPV